MRNRSDPDLAEDQEQTLLQDLQESYAGKMSTRFIGRIHPIASHVMSFGRAIDVLSQAGPTPIAFIWGGIRLILEVSRCCDHLEMLVLS